MTLYQFNALDVNARRNYLWSHGEFLAHGGDHTGPFAFYSLHDYFVEVLFDLEVNTIVSLVPLMAGPSYDRLLSVVKISGLDNKRQKNGQRMNWDSILDGAVAELLTFVGLFIYVRVLTSMGRERWVVGLVAVLGVSAFCWAGILDAENVHDEEQSTKWAIVLAISGIYSVLYGRWDEQRLPEDFKQARDKWGESLNPKGGKYGP